MDVIPWPYPLAGYSLEIEELPALPGGYEWYEITSFGDHLMALGSSGTTFVSAILTSVGGSWTLGTPITDAWFATYFPYRPARRSSGSYAAACGYMKNITSADGLVWALVTPDWTVDFYTPIGAVGDTFYAARHYNSGGDEYFALWSSTNAANWTLVDDASCDSWYPAGQPVALGSDVFIPAYTFHSPFEQTAPALLSGGVLTETRLTTEIGDVMVSGGGDSAMFASTELGAVGLWGTPGNSGAIGFKSDAAAGIRYIVGNINRGDLSDYSLGGFGGNYGIQARRQAPPYDYGLMLFLTEFDPTTGIVFSVATTLPYHINHTQLTSVVDPGGWLDEIYAGPVSGFSFVGPLDGVAIVPGFDTATDAPRPAAVTVNFLPAGADIAITSLPTTVTGIVGTSKYFSEVVDISSSAFAEKLARLGSAVFNIAVPEGAASVTLQFAPNQHPDLYCDIFAGQNMDFLDLYENYDAPFYSWFYNWEEELYLHTQTIPVSGTDTLTVLFRMYAANGVDGRSLTVSFSQTRFWDGLANCIEWSP